MAAMDWAESEFPAARDPYPARRRVRRMGWYLKQPRHVQIGICMYWEGAVRGGDHARASTRIWFIEARDCAAEAGLAFGDAISTDAMEAERSAEHLRRRVEPRVRPSDLALAKRREYTAYRAERRQHRREVATLREALAGETEPELLAVLREKLACVLEPPPVRFSRRDLRFAADGSVDRFAMMMRSARARHATQRQSS